MNSILRNYQPGIGHPAQCTVGAQQRREDQLEPLLLAATPLPHQLAQNEGSSLLSLVPGFKDNLLILKGEMQP